jgi:hypothetical protein
MSQHKYVGFTLFGGARFCRVFCAAANCGAELLERPRSFTSIKTDSKFIAGPITGEIRHG